MGFALEKIQAELRARELDGWLFTDFYGRDAIAYRVLDLPYEHVKRRWYYFLPANGTPKKLVHKIEAGKLDSLPGLGELDKRAYVSWTEQRDGLKAMLEGASRIAMQYSPENAIPYVSLVDAGTIEIVRALGKEVASSADLVQQFESLWTPEQAEMHRKAGVIVDEVIEASFERIGGHVRAGENLTEYAQQQWMLEQFEARGLTTESGPDVAINANASDPHFEPSPDNKRDFRAGDWVLLDVWGKFKQSGAVYYDVTWVGYIGDDPPEQYRKIFGIVREARDAAVEFVQKAFAGGEEIRGFQVDDAARNVIARHGYAEYFFHRTGHSIGEEVHGTGANMDNFETHDDRVVMPGSCFSIEPGVYLPEFGVRLEVNVLTTEGSAEVTGRVQNEIVRIGG